MCADPIADEHSHVVDLDSRGADVHLPACYLLFTDEHADAALPGRPGAVPVLRRVRPRRPGVGRAADPGRPRVPVPQLGPGPHVAFYPSPAGATESELPLDAWERIVEVNPELGRAAPGRRGAARPPHRRRRNGFVLPRADRRLLRAGRPAAAALARLRRRPARRTRRWTSSSPRCASAAGRRRHAVERVMSDYDVLASSTSSPSRTPSRPSSPPGCGSRRRPAQTIHAIALRCQVRIEPQRRRYDEAEQAGLLGLFGERDRWVDTLRPFLWMQCNTTVQGFTGTTEVDLRCPAPTTSRSIGSRYLHALGAGDVPLTLLFSGTVFTQGEHRLRRRAGAVGLRGPLPTCRSRSGGR